ncbi:hypothetical protein [Candidatus Desulfosporosinus nitrosoreducens]|nr:hypothetical protein [Desulfosporosinus sp. PR]
MELKIQKFRSSHFQVLPVRRLDHNLSAAEIGFLTLRVVPITPLENGWQR